MKPMGLTMTIVIQMNSGNYGEGFGNISSLKKLHRGDGNVYTYISRQAIRYSLVNNLKWDDTEVTVDQSVVQYAPGAKIDKYPEIDFFGYMKTTSGESAKTRAAVCRISHAISLEPYRSDLDFLTNMGLAKRINANNAIAQSEIHNSLYAYTVTIDLDRVGEDDEISLTKDEKIERVKKLLKGIKLLSRDIRGRRENLSPIFVIGGVYSIKSPFFENRIVVNKNNLEIELLKNVISMDEEIEASTKVGYLGNMFGNDEEIEKLKHMTIGEFFKDLDERVTSYYESN